MRKSEKNYLENCYKIYRNRPANCGLGSIYKSWSDEKQESYEKIERYLKRNFKWHDLRVLHGNSFRYTCAALAEIEGERYFIVYNESSTLLCYESNGRLIDENGEIFYD